MGKIPIFFYKSWQLVKKCEDGCESLTDKACGLDWSCKWLTLWMDVLFKWFWWSLPKSESKEIEKDSRFRQSWSRWVLLASIRDSHFSASSTLGEVGWPVLVDGLRAEETSITARLLWEILVDLRFQDNVLLGLPWLIWGIFVFWFSVTNCHWLSSLKQHSHLLTVLWVRSLAACGRILC